MWTGSSRDGGLSPRSTKMEHPDGEDVKGQQGCEFLVNGFDDPCKPQPVIEVDKVDEADKVDNFEDIIPTAEAELSSFRSFGEEVDTFQKPIADVGKIPKCVMDCIYPRAMDYGCAYSDYPCICNHIETVASTGSFQVCVKRCPYNGGQRLAPDRILDFCESVDVQVKLPHFMAKELDRRASATGYSPFSTGQGSPNSPGPESGIKNYKGISLGVRIGIGIAIPLIVFIIALIGLLLLRHRRKHRRPQLHEIQEQEKNDGRLPEHIGSIPEIQEPRMPPPSYTGAHEYGIQSSGTPVQEMRSIPPQPASNPIPKHEATRVPQGVTGPTIHEIEAARIPLEAAGVPVHEIEATRLKLQGAGIPVHEIEASQPITEAAGNPRHEFADTQSTQRHELTASPSPYPLGSGDSASFHGSMSRKPVSPPSTTSTPFFPPPWDSTGGSGYDSYERPDVEPQRTAKDLEIQRLEEEVAQVKLRKERLQSLHDLEEQEARLRRTIEEKKTGGPSRS